MARTRITVFGQGGSHRIPNSTPVPFLRWTTRINRSAPYENTVRCTCARNPQLNRFAETPKSARNPQLNGFYTKSQSARNPQLNGFDKNTTNAHNIALCVQVTCACAHKVRPTNTTTNTHVHKVSLINIQGRSKSAELL